MIVKVDFIHENEPAGNQTTDNNIPGKDCYNADSGTGKKATITLAYSL
jgi:hypothetical protein